ncbi:MAG TPA: SelB C-terminal domain-containing protein, partial [Burkholderiaceae bacterium]|nr:SelB C-terminal domain-containing protein [Burkholderiaceae bacterium]
FRLAVDRAFTLPGIGTIATGTVHAGSVRVGEELSLLPVAGGPARARVRGLHAQNVPVAVARSGHRCALQLAGVSKDSLERGQWLLTPAIGLVTDRLDARISLWHEEHTRLRCGTSVHLHHGTADVMARVVVLEGEAVEPGGQALVQLVLQRPVSAWRGDRLVLRDAAATRTLAGGTVLDPLSPARYRRTPQRLAWLAAAGEGDAVSRLGAVVDVSPHGLELATWRRTEGQLPSSLLATPKGAFVAGDWCVGQMQWQSMRGQVIAALERLHAQAPDELGPDAARLRRVALPRVAEGLWSVLLASLLANGELRREGAWLHRPEHGLRLSMEEQRVSRSLLPLMLAGGFDPPWVRDLAAATREPEPLVRATLARMGQRGEAFPIVRDLYYHARRVEELASLVRRLCERDGGVQAALFRDATGLGRKRAIQVLEFFDRIGLTRRVENEHRLRADTSLFDVE